MCVPPGERPFHCTLCEKAFNQKSALQVHMKKHTGERPYKCDYCVMGFTQKSNMKLHMKRAHSYTGKARPRLLGPSPPPPRPWPLPSPPATACLPPAPRPHHHGPSPSRSLVARTAPGFAREARGAHGLATATVDTASWAGGPSWKRAGGPCFCVSGSWLLRTAGSGSQRAGPSPGAGRPEREPLLSHKHSVRLLL